LAVSDVFRLSRKLGFGFRPEEEIPTDFVAWAIPQLTAKPRQLGVAKIRSATSSASPPPEIVEWPGERVWPLSVQINNAIALKKGIEALDRKYDRQSQDYETKRQDLEVKLQPQDWDIIRRAHQAIYGEAPVLERFAHFWANHFTVALKDEVGSVFGHYLDIAIRGNLGGDFATLLYDVTTHPCMQNYLDNAYSVGPKSPEAKQLRAEGHFADIAPSEPGLAAGASEL